MFDILSSNQKYRSQSEFLRGIICFDFFFQNFIVFLVKKTKLQMQYYTFEQKIN